MILRCFLALALACSAKASVCQELPFPEVVARVNGLEISRSDMLLEQQTMRGAGLMASLAGSSQDIKLKVARTAINSLVDRFVILEESKIQGWEVNPEEFRLLAERAMLGFSAILNSKKLEELAVSPTKFKEFVKERIKYDYYVEKVFAKQVIVSKKELRKLFDDSRMRFAQPAKVQINQILIFDKATDPNAVAALKKRAFAIYHQLKKPQADFEKVKQANLSGVPLPAQQVTWVDQVALSRMLGETNADVILHFAPGKVSQPLKTNFGYAILKVLQKQAAKPADFKTAEPILERELKHNRKNKLLHDKIESLKKTAKIEILI